MIQLPYTLNLNFFVKPYFETKKKNNGLYNAWLANEQPDDNGLLHIIGNFYDVEHNILFYNIYGADTKDQDISIIKKNTHIAQTLAIAGYPDEAIKYLKRAAPDQSVKDYISESSYDAGRVHIYPHIQKIQANFHSDNKNIFCPHSVNEINANHKNNIIEATLWVNRSKTEDTLLTYKYDDQGNLYQIDYREWAWNCSDRKDSPIRIAHELLFDKNGKLITYLNEDLVSDFNTINVLQDFDQIVRNEKENAKRLRHNLKLNYSFK